MIDTEERKQRAVLAIVDKGIIPYEESLLELAELARTYGIEVTGQIVQKRENAHNGHYLGTGKVEELAMLIRETGADGVICDDELTGSQIRNLSKMISADVIDRTSLILDIFADRAKSAEGKLQVELASWRYRLTHLQGFGKMMSRIGGGAGTHTRGAGETKLELDRRRIRDRIGFLNNQIKEFQTAQAVSRTRREKASVPVVSLAGYTNAGKSTLLNHLTDAGVLSEDKLFATLDTTARRLQLPGGGECVLVDTVGFIRKLPHLLIDAFRATLDEMRHADVILHVVDASSEGRDAQMEVVYETLAVIGCAGKPVVTAFNKIDKECLLPLPCDSHAEKTVAVSALTGEGIEKLLLSIEEILNKRRKPIKVMIPYQNGKLLPLIHGKCEIVSEEHAENGTLLELIADEELEGRLRDYIVAE